MSIDLAVRQYIKENSFITIDEFMKYALNIKYNSYYKNVKSIGEDGDFITAPEVSQLFGETLALWVINSYQEYVKSSNSQSSFSLVEFGPGTGALMNIILKTIKDINIDIFNNINDIYLIEINPNFRLSQKAELAKYNKNIHFIDEANITSEKLPKKYTIYIANEFFDAMPIKQYVKSDGTWSQRIIKIDDNELYKYSNQPLVKELNEALLHEHINANDGAILEESPNSTKIISNIAKFINQYKGHMIIIDYGYFIYPHKRTSNQYNLTLQAIKQHEYISILKDIGISDLTAHVDFHALSKAILANGILPQNIYFSSQREFLLEYAIDQRCNLLKNTNKDLSHVLSKQLDRLISPFKMGNLFKILCFSSL